MINITINYKEKTINIDLKVKFEVERLLFKHVLFTQTNHALQIMNYCSFLAHVN